MTKIVSFNVAVKFILVSGVWFNSQSFCRWELLTECAYPYVCIVVVFVSLKRILFRFLFVCLHAWFQFCFAFYVGFFPNFCFTLYVHVHIHTRMRTGLWHPSSCARKQCSECNTITQWHMHAHTAHTCTHADLFICVTKLKCSFIDYNIKYCLGSSRCNWI